MSTFGSGSVGTVLVFSCGALVPIFGWGPLVVALILVVGWAFLLGDANRKYYPDGTRRRVK